MKHPTVSPDCPQNDRRTLRKLAGNVLEITSDLTKWTVVAGDRIAGVGLDRPDEGSRKDDLSGRQSGVLFMQAFGEPGEIQAVEQGKDGEVESRAGGQKPAQWHEYGEEDPVEYPPGTFPGVRTPAMNWGQGQGVQVDRPSINHVSGVLGIVLGLSALVPCYVTPPVQSLHSPALGNNLPVVSGAFSS